MRVFKNVISLKQFLIEFDDKFLNHQSSGMLLDDVPFPFRAFSCPAESTWVCENLLPFFFFVVV